MDNRTIRELELLSHNAWVAEEKMRLGGWLLRADHGVTRRANSVLPLKFPGLPLSLAIDSAVEFYVCRDLTPSFQMTEASQPRELDEELAQRGFSVGLQVDVWTADLSTLAGVRSECETETLPEMTDEWIDTYGIASGHEPSTMTTRFAIMKRTNQPHTYAKASIDGAIASVGFGVVEGPWLGVFSVATLPDMRNRGAATAISRELGTWAQEFGAERAYLQVETGNTEAKSLYTKLGFKSAYRYWNRELIKGKESECRSC